MIPIVTSGGRPEAVACCRTPASLSASAARPLGRAAGVRYSRRLAASACLIASARRSGLLAFSSGQGRAHRVTDRISAGGTRPCQPRWSASGLRSCSPPRPSLAGELAIWSGLADRGATPVCRERKIRFSRRSATNTKATQSGPREDQHTDNTNKTALPGTRGTIVTMTMQAQLPPTIRVSWAESSG